MFRCQSVSVHPVSHRCTGQHSRAVQTIGGHTDASSHFFNFHPSQAAPMRDLPSPLLPPRWDIVFNNTAARESHARWPVRCNTLPAVDGNEEARMESAGAVNCCTKRVCVFCDYMIFFQEELVGFPPRCRCTRQDAPGVVAVFALFFLFADGSSAGDSAEGREPVLLAQLLNSDDLKVSTLLLHHPAPSQEVVSSCPVC